MAGEALLIQSAIASVLAKEGQEHFKGLIEDLTDVGQQP
jgi:hypothetical protein